MFEIKEYLEDEIILAQGELGKGFCILEEGTLEVIRDDLILNEIDQKGAIFGELSEVLLYKRGASVRAKTKARIKHYADTLETLVAQNPKFAVKLIRNLGRRLYHMNNIAVEGNSKNNIFRKQFKDPPRRIQIDQPCIESYEIVAKIQHYRNPIE